LRRILRPLAAGGALAAALVSVGLTGTAASSPSTCRPRRSRPPDARSRSATSTSGWPRPRPARSTRRSAPTCSSAASTSAPPERHCGS